MVLFLGIFFSVSLLAQDQRTNRIDSFFQYLASYQQLNGNTLLAENGKIVFSKSIGLATIGQQIPNDVNTRFSIGSVSKIFTATAILQLKEKGRLGLDDKFTRYFSHFPYPDISIRNLLNHTSGLPDYELFESLVEKAPDKRFTNADLIPALIDRKTPLYFQPGEKWKYANTNFILLALLVEKISGMPFRAYLQKKVFSIAGMTDTYLPSTKMRLFDNRRASNYQFSHLYDLTPTLADSIPALRWRTYNLSGFEGPGNIITTTNDLLKFDQALYSGRLLKESTLNEAFTPSRLNNGNTVIAGNGLGQASYGLGWFIFTDSSQGKIVWHGGGQPGAVAIFLRNISRHQVVILLDNQFSDGMYRNGLTAMGLLNGRAATLQKSSLAMAYGRSLVKNGIDIAFCELQQMRLDTINFKIDEEQLNLLGYQLMFEAPYDNHQNLALEVFKNNVWLFPNSFNVYDSYGEAMLKSGNKSMAMKLYNKALELKPGNPETIEALKNLSDEK